MYTNMYAYIHTCMYMYMDIHIHMYVHTCTCTYVGVVPMTFTLSHGRYVCYIHTIMLGCMSCCSQVGMQVDKDALYVVS